MDILITNDDAAKYIENSNKTLWWLYFRKSFLFYLIILVLGVYLLVTGISQGYDDKFLTSQYHDEIEVINKMTIVNYHRSVAFGMGFIFTFLCLFYVACGQTIVYFKATKKVSNRYRLKNNNFTIRITDQSLYFQDFELTQDFKWTIFYGYKVRRGCILLLRYNSVFSGFVIPTKQLTSHELTDLLQFLKKRLPEKR